MRDVWDRFGADVVPVLVVTLVLGVAWYAFIVPRRIAAGRPRPDARRATIAEIGTVVFTAPWIGLIMAPTGGEGGLMLRPFHDLLDVLRGPDTIVQVLGNLVALSGIGFWLPIRFRLAPPRWVPVVVLLIGGVVSVGLETIQYLLPTGRVASVDDVMVNAAGAALASLLSKPWWASRRRAVTAASP